MPYSLTLDQAAAAPATLKLTAVILAVIMPIIYGYLALQYRVFRGKTHEFHAERPTDPLRSRWCARS